jgi:hypothetical protein
MPPCQMKRARPLQHTFWSLPSPPASSHSPCCVKHPGSCLSLTPAPAPPPPSHFSFPPPGEHKATSGLTWRHPNLRLAYVAQHAFHHLEEHLDTTPLKYMFRRFGLGEDKEEAHKVRRMGRGLFAELCCSVCSVHPWWNSELWAGTCLFT